MGELANASRLAQGKATQESLKCGFRLFESLEKQSRVVRKTEIQEYLLSENLDDEFQNKA